jgi:SAM-dependent methyltransferase
MSIQNRFRLLPPKVLLFGWLLLLGAGVAVCGQSPAPPQETQRATSTPYSGDLSIFDYPDRAQKLHIDQVMDMLGIQPGKSVADVGAGSGWFTVLAARRVTNTSRVYAVDINPEAAAYIDKRVKSEKLANVTVILGTPDNPKLPANSVDAILLLKVYHEVAKPIDLMRNVRSSLRPGARVGIIDRNGNGDNHGVSKAVVIQEMGVAGYRLAGEHDELVKDDKVDYFLIFKAKPLIALQHPWGLRR